MSCTECNYSGHRSRVNRDVDTYGIVLYAHSYHNSVFLSCKRCFEDDKESSTKAANKFLIVKRRL